MNVFKLIQALETLASTASTSYDYMVLSKAIQLLKLGRIQTVATAAALPTNLTTDGNLYYVSSEEDLYYNQGSTWNLIYSFTRIAYSWGSGSFGQLGDNTSLGRSSPVTVAGGITNWSQISAGDLYTLAVKDGIAYAWGSNGQGRLGDNTTSSRSSPVSVAGNITNWIQLSACPENVGAHSLGVTASGLAYAWGDNYFGQLGSSPAGYNSSRLTPVIVVGGISNWIQVSAGWRFSLGLTSTGIAYGWGSDAAGQLGQGTAASRSSPVSVVGGITNWARLAAGYSSHSLGRTSSGVLYAWGFNGQGQLGDNTTSNRSSPVTVVGGITAWASLSAVRHSLATTSDGIAYAWGLNTNGRLGDNTTSNRSSPVTVVGGITNWSQLAAGGTFSLGITSTGVAYAWGYNTGGQLGDGTTVAKSSPVSIIGGFTNWFQVSAGGNHGTGITSTIF